LPVLWDRRTTETDAAGNPIVHERRTTINHAMKTCRRAWKVAARRNPGKVPPLNPFSQMGSKAPTARHRRRLMPSCRRSAPRRSRWAYRSSPPPHWSAARDSTSSPASMRAMTPKERPNAVRVLHEKASEENWVPLFDERAPLYPELMAELDAIKRDRIGA
jgi:hypothetical protein